ncbi:MAG: ribosomal L7Ae/L30e/S12e/Gadd45 family protein [Ruminiclostridium sp.]|nr:ribosomal L7Ae/L30e/S12e/Gadd45 family protein [Ruminiclostridium sp.]
MNNRLATIGLCRRAGKLVLGFDAVVAEIKSPKKTVSGVLLASDLSEKTKKEVRYECEKAGTAVDEIPETLDELKRITGKRAGVIAVLDDGLYSSAIKTITH